MDFITFDTDYMPSLSAVPLEEDPKEDIAFTILEIKETMSKDPNIVIVPTAYLEDESSILADMLKTDFVKVVGKGTTSKSIGQLMYGLQHTTRTLYKHTIQEAFKKFTADDQFIRTSSSFGYKEDSNE